MSNNTKKSYLPLHSFWEYQSAVKSYNLMLLEFNSKGLSEHQQAEMNELKWRIQDFEIENNIKR